MDQYGKIIATIEVEQKQFQDNEKKVAELTSQKQHVEKEITDWTFLCKAFDKTGIPVLKLENSGVEITMIANDLLSLFENKFRIVFETTSLTKDKKKLKETFDINIVEEDGVCEISNKSGGQQVWLETAIQLAISQVSRQQGKNIETGFLDEKDGALDLNNAYAYIEMIRKAHQMSGVHNTFVITHRSELLDFIPQQVKLVDGYLELVN
jgi:DNA repair exonuclease SbcCD ATPase subunit